MGLGPGRRRPSVTYAHGPSLKAGSHTHTQQTTPRDGPHLPPLNNRAGRGLGGQRGSGGAREKTTMTSFHGRSLRLGDG